MNYPPPPPADLRTSRASLAPGVHAVFDAAGSRAFTLLDLDRKGTLHARMVLKPVWPAAGLVECSFTYAKQRDSS
jgi:hypothetical protein